MRENATYYLGSEGFGMDDVRKFRAAIQAGVKRARSAAAPQLSTYVGEKAETPSYLSSSKAADPIEAYATELDATLARMYENNDRILSLVDDATANVELAQD